MTPEDLQEFMNDRRFQHNISMYEVVKRTGRSYRSIRHFFKGTHDTTIYLVFDIMWGMGVRLTMDGKEVETHDDAMKIIHAKFNGREYRSVSKMIGISPTALRDTILGENSRISTFLKVCNGLGIDVGVTA